MGLVDRQALGLEEGARVPVDAQPCQGLENGVHGLLGGTDHVRVLDAQHEFALHVAGVEPVEQGRAGPPDVQVAGRAGRKTGDDGVHGCLPYIVGRKGARIQGVKDSSACFPVTPKGSTTLAAITFL